MVPLISGGLGGFAGVSELCGLGGYLTLDLSPGFGYSGIVVAMHAAQHPLGVVLSALFVAVISIFDGLQMRVQQQSTSIVPYQFIS